MSDPFGPLPEFREGQPLSAISAAKLSNLVAAIEMVRKQTGGPAVASLGGVYRPPPKPDNRERAQRWQYCWIAESPQVATNVLIDGYPYAKIKACSAEVDLDCEDVPKFDLHCRLFPGVDSNAPDPLAQAPKLWGCNPPLRIGERVPYTTDQSLNDLPVCVYPFYGGAVEEAQVVSLLTGPLRLSCRLLDSAGAMFGTAFDVFPQTLSLPNPATWASYDPTVVAGTKVAIVQSRTSGRWILVDLIVGTC